MVAATIRTSTSNSPLPPSRRTFESSSTAQQLGLSRHGHLADLIHATQSPVLCQFEASGAPLGSSRERPLLVPEQFALNQCLRQRRAVDRNKRSLPPRTQRVDRASHQLLTRSAFARYQHARLARSGLLQQDENLLHTRRASCQLTDHALVLELPLKNLLLGAEPGKCPGASQQHL